MTEDPFKSKILNRHLIVIASGQYDRGSHWDGLPVGASVHVWNDWLTAQVLDDRRFKPFDDKLADSPTSADVEGALKGTEGIGSADAVVVYIIGHGEEINGSHWLALRDSDDKKPTSTMIETKDLIGWISETGVQYALVIIDTCYAGKVGEYVFRRDQDLPKGWIGLATTSPTKKAYAGTLTEALAAFLHQAQQSDKWGSDQEQYFDVYDLLRYLSNELDKNGQPLFPLTRYPAGGSPCLPNPRYDPDVGRQLTTEPVRSDLAIRAEDLSSHWGPRSRGLQTSRETGWLFSGRHRLMADLVKATRSPTGGVWMVNGTAGCGKSAVLSRLVTLSDPLFVDAHASEIGDLPAEVRPAVGAVDVAVLATRRATWEIIDQIHGALRPNDPHRNQQRKSPAEPQAAQLDQVAQLQAAQLQAAQLNQVVDTLLASDEPICVVIDAVDEARKPGDLVSEALAPLVTRAGAKLRLILGVRSSGEPGIDHWSLADSAASLLHASVLRADASPFWERSDLVNYLDELLVRSDSEKPSPYAANRDISRATAEVLADLVGTSFVLGRVVAVELASRDTVQDPDDPKWHQQVGNGLVAVLRAELQRSFPDSDDHARALAVMGAPAMSFGRGLPWQRVWPTIATALAQGGKAYGDADIAQILEHRISGYLVRELDDTGTTVYRPFHEAVRAALLDNLLSDVSTTHRDIALALEALIPKADTASNIIEPETYVRRHLADHAEAGGVLDKLLNHAEFVLTADPIYLAATLGGVQGRGIGANEAAVLRCMEHLRSGNADLKASHLALCALQSGADELASGAGTLAAGAAWRPVWARWSLSPPYTVLARLRRSGGITAICAVGGDPPLVVAALGSGELVCLELISAREVWRKTFPDGEGMLAAAPGVLAVGETSQITLLDPLTGEPKPNGVVPIPFAGGEHPNGNRPHLGSLGLTYDGDELLLAAGTFCDNPRAHPPTPTTWQIPTEADFVTDRSKEEYSKSGRLLLWRVDTVAPQLKWNVPAFGFSAKMLDWRRAERGLQIVAAGNPDGEHPWTSAIARVFDAKTGAVLHEIENKTVDALWADWCVVVDDTVVLSTESRDYRLVRWLPESGVVARYRSDAPVQAIVRAGDVLLIRTYEGVIPFSLTKWHRLGAGPANWADVQSMAVVTTPGSFVVVVGSKSGELTTCDLAPLLAGTGWERMDIQRCSPVAGGMVACGIYDRKGGILETIRVTDGALIARTERIGQSTALHVIADRPNELFSAVDPVVDSFNAVDPVDERENRPGQIRRLAFADHAPVAAPLLYGQNVEVRGFADASGWLLACGDGRNVCLYGIETGLTVPPLRHEFDLTQVDVVEVAGKPTIVALDYRRSLILWDWDETLQGRADFFHTSRNAARGKEVRGDFLGVDDVRAPSAGFAVWRHGDETVFLRPGQDGWVYMKSLPSRREDSWRAHSRRITAIQRLGADMVVTGGSTGLVRIWWLPDRSLMTEAGLGAAISTLRVVDEDQILVGTESGLALLRLELPLTGPA